MTAWATLELLLDQLVGSAPLQLTTIANRRVDPVRSAFAGPEALRFEPDEAEQPIVDVDDWLLLRWDTATFCFSTSPDPSPQALADRLPSGDGTLRHGISCLPLPHLTTITGLRRCCFAGLAVARCSRDLFQGTPLDVVGFIRKMMDRERIHVAATAFHVAPLDLSGGELPAAGAVPRSSRSPPRLAERAATVDRPSSSSATSTDWPADCVRSTGRVVLVVWSAVETCRNSGPRSLSCCDRPRRSGGRPASTGSWPYATGSRPSCSYTSNRC